MRPERLIECSGIRIFFQLSSGWRRQPGGKRSVHCLPELQRRPNSDPFPGADETAVIGA